MIADFGIALFWDLSLISSLVNALFFRQQLSFPVTTKQAFPPLAFGEPARMTDSDGGLG